MQNFIFLHYLWFKAFHLIFVMAWMAGLFYLPRLFVYHASAEKGSELAETLKIMERRLIRVIMNPAMILVWVFGGLMVWGNPDLFHQGWFHVKLTFAVFMTVFHHTLSLWRKRFVKDANIHSAVFYRKINEIPTVFMMIIVIMAIVRPF